MTKNYEQDVLELKEKLDVVYRKIPKAITPFYNGISNELTSEVLKLYYEVTTKILEMNEVYKCTTNNRQELISELSSLTDHFRLLNDFVHQSFSNLELLYRGYSSRQELYYNDFEKLLNIIYKAQDLEDIAFKKIPVYGEYISDEKIVGMLYVIGEANLLKEFKDDEKYKALYLYRLLCYIESKTNHSLIMATTRANENNDVHKIIPYEPNDIIIKGNKDIYCHLNNDVFNEIINNLLEYAKQNGYCISDIPEEVAIENIKPGKTRKLKP